MLVHVIILGSYPPPPQFIIAAMRVLTPLLILHIHDDNCWIDCFDDFRCDSHVQAFPLSLLIYFDFACPFACNTSMVNIELPLSFFQCRSILFTRPVAPTGVFSLLLQSSRGSPPSIRWCFSFSFFPIFLRWRCTSAQSHFFRFLCERPPNL